MTPGPWHYVTGAVWTTPAGPDDGGQCVALRSNYADINPVDRDDNMRLCAAAPDLLAALKYVAEFQGARTAAEYEVIAKRARIAIAKAQGANA